LKDNRNYIYTREYRDNKINNQFEPLSSTNNYEDNLDVIIIDNAKYAWESKGTKANNKGSIKIAWIKSKSNYGSNNTVNNLNRIKENKSALGSYNSLGD